MRFGSQIRKLVIADFAEKCRKFANEADRTTRGHKGSVIPVPSITGRLNRSLKFTKVSDTHYRVAFTAPYAQKALSQKFKRPRGYIGATGYLQRFWKSLLTQ